MSNPPGLEFTRLALSVSGMDDQQSAASVTPEDQAKHREYASEMQAVRIAEMEALNELPVNEVDRIHQAQREAFDWWEKSFGIKVRDWRKARGWSQDDLASELNDLGFEMHQTTVAKIERGARPLRVSEAVAIAHIFGVPALAVFNGPGPENEPWSAKRMREHLEFIEAGAQQVKDRLESAAKDLAYWESSKAAAADALNRAALRADSDATEA